MENSDQKAKQPTNDLVVLQDAMKEFANPISKITFQALPRIYGKRKKKKYAIKYDFQVSDKLASKEKVYPIHHCFQEKDRVINSRVVRQIQLDNQSSAKRYKTEIKKTYRQSAEKLSKPKKEVCDRKYCFCNKEHNQALMRSDSKEQIRLNYFRGKSIRLPEISKSLEPDDVESKHKVSMIRQQTQSQRKKRPLTLLDLLRSNQRQLSNEKSSYDQNDQNANNPISEVQGFSHRHLSQNNHAQSVSVQTQFDSSQQVPVQHHKKQISAGPLGSAQANNNEQNDEDSETNKEKKQKNNELQAGAKNSKQNEKIKVKQIEPIQDLINNEKQRSPIQELNPSSISRNSSKAQVEGQFQHQIIQNRFAQMKQNYQNNLSSDSEMDDSRSIASSLSSSSISKYVFAKTKNAATVFQNLNKQQRKNSFDSKARVKSERLSKQEKADDKKKRDKFNYQKKNGLFVIPEEDEYVDYIKDYEPMNQKLKMKNLIKNQNFQVLRSDDGVYFGEVVDEKRHGKGIMVTEKTIFEGKYNSDIKVQGCERNIDGVYRGQFLNGVREGYGTFEWNNGEVFQGEWKKGTKNGFGIWKSPKGDFYEGEWRNNRQHGKGVFKHRLSTYRGYFIDFLKCGEGEEIFTNGDRYIGLYKDGKPHGKGRYQWADGSVFEGEFKSGVRDGFGIWKYSNGTVYEGCFKNDFKCGKGKQTYKTGEMFEGLFKDGQKYEGTLYDSNKNPIKITNEV